MIEGVFRDGHPRVVLTVTGENDSVEVEFIVDSGYDGFLSLPSFVLERVGATPENFRTVVLADETEVRTISATVTIEWHDEPREVRVSSLQGDPLMGTALLMDHHLHVEMQEGGEVIIEPL